jgi:hypothetical protein
MKEGYMETDIKGVFANQLEAAICTLNQCVDNCPKKEWHEKHEDYRFSQVVFHTLFYTDYYLSKNEDDFKSQDFHKENESLFEGYEELEDRIPQRIYTREEIDKYFSYCRTKIRLAIESEDEESLSGNSGFEHKNMTRAELYVSLIRHIQHHAAQLGLRVQRITGRELSWIQSGCKDS